MTLLQDELEEWQTGKKKSEQIRQLQSEIAAMETALEGMTKVSHNSYKRAIRSPLVLIFWCISYIWCVLRTEFITIPIGNGGKRSLTRKRAGITKVAQTRGELSCLCLIHVFYLMTSGDACTYSSATRTSGSNN